MNAVKKMDKGTMRAKAGSPLYIGVLKEGTFEEVIFTLRLEGYKESNMVGSKVLMCLSTECILVAKVKVIIL